MAALFAIAFGAAAAFCSWLAITMYRFITHNEGKP